LYITGNSEEDISRRISEFYKSSYWNKKDISTEEAIKSNYSDINSMGKRRQWISQFAYCRSHMEHKKKLLEIGSSQGQTLVWFEEQGFSVTGIEPDERNSELINQKLKSGKCISGLIEEVDIDKKFDVIWISHVIEHLLRPDKLLAKLKKYLEDDGVIFIEVPNCENDQVLKDSILTQPHTFHFSKNALLNLSKNAGYKVERYDFFRPPTLVEGGLNKIMKKYPYYPKIITTNSKGTDIRIILRNSQ
jgi:2-polyprenyl-3-methyl-5-hydroxy-6-metoxy-1,4-benzoquinol methylase